MSGDFQDVEVGAVLWAVRLSEFGDLQVEVTRRTVAKVTPQRLRFVEDEGTKHPDTVHRERPNDDGMVAHAGSWRPHRFYATHEQAVERMQAGTRLAVENAEADLLRAQDRHATALAYRPG